MLGEIAQTTIAAIATPSGPGAIGIIRLSGPDSLPIILRIARTLLGNAPDLRSHRTTLVSILDPDTAQLVDEALVTYFKAPHSFTGEDTVEISCHGSPVVLSQVISLLCREGAQLAEPGEFSLRAFLNHRLDLVQAEAINDLINSRTTFQARLAVRQLRGELSRQIAPLRGVLIDLIVRFESAVEFVEDDLDPLDSVGIFGQLSHLIDQMERLASSYQYGRLIQKGVKLALVGLPNVGKSSIFNALLGYDRAIVTAVPGTTRDTLNEQFVVNGIPVSIIDTAGIRETIDEVELAGIERTRSAAVDADYVIAITESSSLFPSVERQLFSDVPINIFVVNKCDLGPVVCREILLTIAADRPVVEVSALNGQGIDKLRQTIFESIVVPRTASDESPVITNERHYLALRESIISLKVAHADLSSGFTEEVALDNLHKALRSLGVITGETLIGDIIGQIFSTFCIGK